MASGQPSPRRTSLAPALASVAALFAVTWVIVTRSTAPVLAHGGPGQAVVSASAVIALGVAALLAWTRLSVSGCRRDLLIGMGFAVLAASNVVAALASFPAASGHHVSSLALTWGIGQAAGGLLFVGAHRDGSRVDRFRTRVVLVCITAAVGFAVAASIFVVLVAGNDAIRLSGSVLDILAAVMFFAAGSANWRGLSPNDESRNLALALPLCIAGFNAIEYAVYPVIPSDIQLNDLVRGLFAMSVLALCAGTLVSRASQLAAARKEVEALRALSSPPDDTGVAGVSTHVARVIGDLLGAHVRISLSAGEPGGEKVREPVTALDGEEVAASAPLRAGLRRLGVLLATREPGRSFSAHELEVLQACAAQASLTLDRSLLQEEVAAAAVLQERSRLAREVHDGLAQHLAFLKMRIAWLRRSSAPLEGDQLSELEEVLESALSDARQAITTLRTEPHGPSTADALAGYAAEVGQLSKLSVQVVHDAALPEVGPLARAELLRIVQEAFNNTRKHASASTAWLEIRARGRGIEVTVRDDGAGFEPRAGVAGHFGLDIMRERAQSVGGHCDVQSAPGRGTTVRVWIPAVEHPAGDGHDLGLAHG